MNTVEQTTTETRTGQDQRPVNWNEPDKFMQLYGWVEALIFASEAPLTLDDLQSILANFAPGIRPEILQSVIREMIASYSHPTRGFHLVEVAEGWQFRTNIDYVKLLRALFSHNPPRISQAALECMAIVAYRQPMTRVEIDAIRGVDSGGVMRGLLERSLVQVVGRAKTPGRPYLYGTSPAFLEYFGLKSLRDLPSFMELSMDVPTIAFGEGAESAQQEGQQGEETTARTESGTLSTKEQAQQQAQQLYQFMRNGPVLGRE